LTAWSTDDLDVCFVTSYTITKTSTEGAAFVIDTSLCPGDVSCRTITYSATTARTTSGPRIPYTYENIVTVTGGKTFKATGMI
jgi:hypothetical protein